MDEHCDVGWLSCRQSRQNGAFPIVDSESMLAISEDISSVGVVHASIAITGKPDKFLESVDGLDAVLDSMLCTADLELAHVEFRCGAWFIVVPCPARVGCFLSDIMSLPAVSAAMSLGMQGGQGSLPSLRLNVRACSVFQMSIDESRPSMKISFSAYSSYVSPQRSVFATNSSTYCDGFMPAGCTNFVIANSVSAMISLVAYFSRRKFTSWG